MCDRADVDESRDGWARVGELDGITILSRNSS